MPTEPLRIRFRKVDSAAQTPQRHHDGDAAFDLFSLEQRSLAPHERAAFRTGWAMEFPAGYVGRILPRSGLALNYGVQVLGGVIDSNYRGEWKVILVNLGNELVDIRVGDRIAQAVFYPVAQVEFEETQELSDSSRGSDGFGSTGR